MLGELAVVHWLESLRGLPTAALLGPLVAPYAGREAYLCGPGPFMDAAEAALRRERCLSLRADAFAAAAPAPAPAPATGAEVEVELDGTVRAVPWSGGTPLRDALLAAGLPAPYSCR
ncbi:hypothetical protein [Streptomyces sp. NPDC085540]|uniref:hypothetical protein n=1 Tax=Streptomyces sp. NPDC085540 TaxID=3365730 RepID=UPI0037D32792